MGLMSPVHCASKAPTIFVSLSCRAAENHDWLGFALAQEVNAARWGLVRAKGDSLGGAI
jgi:hypothetical protein